MLEPTLKQIRNCFGLFTAFVSLFLMNSAISPVVTSIVRCKNEIDKSVLIFHVQAVAIVVWNFCCLCPRAINERGLSTIPLLLPA